MDFKSVFNSDFCFDIDALVIIGKISSYCVIDIFFLSEGGGGNAHYIPRAHYISRYLILLKMFLFTPW